MLAYFIAESLVMKWKQKVALKVFSHFFIKSKHRCFFWKQLCCFAKPYVKHKVKSKLPNGGGEKKKKKKEKKRNKKKSNDKKKKDYKKI